MNLFTLHFNQPRKHSMPQSPQRLWSSVFPTRSLKIAIVSDRVYPYFKGGAEKRYWEIAKSLTDAGHEIHFYTGQWPGMPRQSQLDGIFLHGIYHVGKFYVNGHKSITESLIYAIMLLPYLLAEDYDLLECEQFPLLSIFTAKIAAIIRRRPLVVTWHEVWGPDLWIKYLGQLGQIGAWIEMITVHLPDRIVSVSEYTTNKLTQMNGVAKSKISTIPNGIDPRWNRRDNATTGHGSEPIYASAFPALSKRSADGNRRSGIECSDLITVGRLVIHKNVDMLLHVVANVKQSHPNIKCMIIGDGPERAKLEKLAKHLGIQMNVQFLGYIENERRVYSLIASSRVFLLPSVREGFGIAVLEANVCGVPALVINHKDNAACQLVKEGQNGYICHSDSNEIAERVIQVLDAPRQQYARACHEAADDFVWARIGKSVEKVYASMLARQQVGRVKPCAALEVAELASNSSVAQSGMNK